MQFSIFIKGASLNQKSCNKFQRNFEIDSDLEFYALFFSQFNIADIKSFCNKICGLVIPVVLLVDSYSIYKEIK